MSGATRVQWGYNSSVHPEECAIAVGIPLDRADFEDKRTDPSRGDFVRHIVEGSGFPDNVVWDYAYGPTAVEFQRILGDVESHNVTVIRAASLSDFHAQFSTARVVTLFSHAPILPLTPADIVNPEPIVRRLMDAPADDLTAESLWRELELPRDTDERRLRDGLPARLPAVVARANERYLKWLPPVARKSWLRRILARWGLAHDSVTVSAAQRPDSHWTRPAFERAFPGALREGRYLEFSDRLATIGEFVSGIPEEFPGTIDMLNCHGALIAPAIRKRCKACMARWSPPAITLVPALVQYELVISALAKAEMSYLDALELLAKIVRKECPC